MVERALAVRYLLAWQEAPMVDDAAWLDLEALVRAEAAWPEPAGGVAQALASPRR